MKRYNNNYKLWSQDTTRGEEPTMNHIWWWFTFKVINLWQRLGGGVPLLPPHHPPHTQSDKTECLPVLQSVLRSLPASLFLSVPAVFLSSVVRISGVSGLRWLVALVVSA